MWPEKNKEKITKKGEEKKEEKRKTFMKSPTRFGYFSRLLSKLFPPQIQHKTLQSRKRNGIEHHEH